MTTVLDHPDLVEQIGAQIEREFAEMPGLRLTEAQIRRRWLLTAAECADVLSYLTLAGHLARDRGGQFCRRDYAF